MAQVPKAQLNNPSAGPVSGSLAQRSENLPGNAFGQESSNVQANIELTRGNIEVATGNIRQVQLGIEKDYAQSLAEAGRSMVQTGGAITSAGMDLTRQILADRALQNETEALNASTSFAQSTNALQSEYLSLQGTNATNSYETYAERIREAQEATLEGITNPDARRMAQARIAGQTTQVLGGMDRYRQQQVRQANVTARTSAAAMSINEGVVQRFNPRGMVNALNQGLSEVAALGETAGWDDATQQLHQAQFRGRFYTSVIASLAEGGDDAGVRAANDLFTRVRGTMDAESSVRVENALSGPVRRADANGRVAAATTGAEVAPPVAAPTTDNDMQATSRRIAASIPNVTVTGTDRTPERNAAVGGARDSQHLHGRAIDFRLSGTDEEKAAAMQRILSGEFGPVGGVGAYNDGSLHIDFRTGARAAWGQDRTQASLGSAPAWFRQAVTTWRSSPSSAQPRDRGQMLETALRGTEDNPQLRAETMSQFNSRMNVLDATNAQERTQMERRVRDINTALAAGSTATIPEQDIRRLFQPAQADAILDQLRTNEIAGQVFTSAALATPTQIAELQNDLVTGQGPVTALLRERRGITTIDGRVSEEDQGSDSVARTALRQVLEQRIAAREQTLRSDPAEYVRIDPTVRAAAAAVSAAGQNATPEMRATLALASRSAQARLGVLEGNQRVLPKAQSEAIVDVLTRGDPAQTNVGQQLQQLQRTYGEAWPLVLNDLVRDGRLPREYEVLANIPSSVGQTDFQRMMVAARGAGGMEDLTKRLGANRTLVDRAVAEGMQGFNGTSTASGASGGQVLAGNVTQAAINLAYYYALQGQTPETAAANAINRIVNDKYDISGTIRVPRGMLNEVSRAQAVAIAALRPEQLPDRGGNADLLPDERRAIDFRAATQRGFWVTNQRDNGIVLMMQVENGGRIPVRREDGSMIELRFNNLPQPVIPGASEPQRDSPARGVRRIEGFDDPAPANEPRPQRLPDNRPNVTPQALPLDAPQPRRPRTGRANREPNQ